MIIYKTLGIDGYSGYSGMGISGYSGISGSSGIAQYNSGIDPGVATEDDIVNKFNSLLDVLIGAGIITSNS